MAGGLITLKIYVDGDAEGKLREVTYYSDDGTAGGKLTPVSKPTDADFDAMLAARGIGPGSGGGGGNGGELTFASRAAAQNANVPNGTANIVLLGYAAAGDAPVVRLRPATASEQSLPGVLTTNGGSKFWIFDAGDLVPEWFGAKGNASGMSATNPIAPIAAAAGADDAPAFRDMLAVMSALRVHGTTIPGKRYRMGSHTAHPGGQKSVFVPMSNTHLRIRSDLIHDSYDAVSGGPMFFFSGGTSSARVSNIRLIFDGGSIIHPADAVKPRPNALKGSITMYHTDDFEIVRAKKSGSSPTNFQISVFNSSNGFIDGGSVGYPIAPTGVGDDGVHVIVSGTGNACRDIRVRNMVVNSGDDPISITAELNAVNCVIERVYYDTIIGSTPIANIIKVHIVNDEAQGGTDKTNGCTIQDVYISNVIGRLLGNLQGAACTIQNDDYTKNNVIRRIYIDKLDGKIGTLPKVNPTQSLQGQAIRVFRADEVHFTNTVIYGQQNAQLLFSNSKGSSFNGTLINDPTNTSSVALLSGVAVASAANQGSRRRVTFSGSPDLSAVAAQVTAASGLDPTNVNDIRFPILTLTGMAVAGYNGSFVIKAVDNTAKWVEIDNLRSSTADEATATGTAAIFSGTMPVVMLLDCDSCKVDARVVSPLSWATAYIAGRSGTSKRCEVFLNIEGQRFGHAIFTQKSERGRYSVVGRDCKSGSIMMYASPGGSGTQLTPYNHFLASDDFDALADPQQGWARTVLSEFATDRFDLIRGRTPTRIQGSVTQAAGSTLVGGANGIGANIAAYGGHLSTNVNARHLRSLTPRSGGHDGIADVNWDSQNGKFVINTKTAPTAAVTWDYVIGTPD